VSAPRPSTRLTVTAPNEPPALVFVRGPRKELPAVVAGLSVPIPQRPVRAETRSRDRELHILVHEPGEPITPQWSDGRAGRLGCAVAGEY
jgi:hypothetical protein